MSEHTKELISKINAALATAKELKLQNMSICADRVVELIKCIESEQAENAALRAENAALLAYARHKPMCAIVGGYGYCDCGFEALQKAEAI